MLPLGPAFQVSGIVSTDAFPEVDMDDNGNFMVVWTAEPTAGAGHVDVFARRYDSDGNPLGPAFVVNTATAGNQSQPDVTFIPSMAPSTSGEVVIVWSDQDSDREGVFGNVFDRSDNPILPQEALINASEQGLQTNAAITATDTGFVVAWEHNAPPAPAEIRGRTFGINAVPVSGELRLVTGPFVSNPDVDIDAVGDFVVAWQCYQCSGMGSYEEVRVQRFDSGGTPNGTEISANEFTIDNQRSPQVEVSASGEFLVTWDNGDQAMPHFQQFDASGNQLRCQATGPCERLAAQLPSDSFKPRHVDPALADDGSFATVYETFVSGPGPRIDGLLFDPNGNIVDSNPADTETAQFVVHDSTSEGSAARNPRIATNGTGRFVVVYDDTDYFVAARLFTSTPSVGTTTTTMPSPTCGDPNGNGRSTASEALLALQTAIGTGSCPACLCDMDGSGTITASDALLILRAAVGFAVTFACPACP